MKAGDFFLVQLALHTLTIFTSITPRLRQYNVNIGSGFESFGSILNCHLLIFTLRKVTHFSMNLLLLVGEYTREHIWLISI